MAAVGAEPIVPRIPGMDGPNVVMALPSYGIEARLGDEIAVIGGGQVGCETALHLAKLGKKRVTVIEMQSTMAPDASDTHRTELLFELEAAGVVLLPSARCERVSEAGLVYRDENGQERELRADKVIVAVGMRSREGEADSFRAAAPRFMSIGDCVRPATVEWAMRSAFAAVSLI